MAPKTFTLEQLRQLAIDTATRHGLDAGLFLSQIQTESNFDPLARDYQTGTHYGLGQLGAAAVEDVGGDMAQIFDPEANLEYTARYMKMMTNKFGNYFDALRAYNVGPARAAADKRAGSGYANKVLGGSIGQVLDPSASGIVGPYGGGVNPTVAGKAIAASNAATGSVVLNSINNRLWDLIDQYGVLAAMVTIIALFAVFGIYAMITGETVPSPKTAVSLLGKL